MRKSHNRPRNEQDFERLCLRLLRAHWQCPELQLYASRGESQHGVDIIDESGGEPLRGAQCKLHEEGKATTRSEVKAEIEKAKEFIPPLDHYAIMTTGKVKVEVNDTIIQINKEHRKETLFIVEVFDWGRIEDLLDEYTNIRDWYEGDLPLAGAGPRIESKVDELLKVTKQISAPDGGGGNQDRFHAEIDEVRDLLEKHDYQIAKLLLQRIKVRSWDKLNARHKFRVLSNLASVEVSADNPAGAAELYLEAKQYQPADEIARTNEALAYLMLGRRERAFELADKLREEFPRAGRVLGIFIQSAPDSRPLESLEDSMPKDLLDKDEVATALTQRALDSGELQKAEQFVKAATVANTRAFGPWLLLGKILLQSEMSRSRERYGTEALFCDAARLREAEDALGEAFILANETHSTSGKVEALLNRRLARVLLGKEAEARSDLEEARQIAPRDQIVIETYGESLRLEGKLDDALDCMRRVPPGALSDHGQMMLGMLLLERGDSGDYHIAGDLLSRVAKSEARLPKGFREHCIDIGLQAFAREERFDARRKFLEEVPGGTVSEVGLKTLTAKLHLLKGQQGEASKCADEALALTKDATPAFDVRRLALLLSALGRFNDALSLWQRVAVLNVLSSDTRHLLECASRLDRHEVMLETFGKLRQAGAIDRTLLDSELSLLEMYDIDNAIKILDQEITQRPEDKELKLRRSMLGLALDRADLVDQDPSSVPKPDVVEPRTALRAVHVLKAIRQEQYAVQYAYDVIRYNFQDPDAHRVFMLALAPFGNELQLEKPDCVETEAAVCYVEQGDSVPHWIIVEDSPDPDSQLREHELSPDNEICKAMMGKKVGDTFVLAKGIQDRIGEIREIQNKYVHRFQDCMGQWQVRFPRLPDAQAFKVPQKAGKSDELEFDISAILQFVDERHENVRKVERIYKERRLTLHMFGKHFGKTVFEVLRHLASSPDALVKCCIGVTDRLKPHFSEQTPR